MLGHGLRRKSGLFLKTCEVENQIRGIDGGKVENSKQRDLRNLNSAQVTEDQSHTQGCQT